MDFVFYLKIVFILLSGSSMVIIITLGDSGVLLKFVL